MRKLAAATLIAGLGLAGAAQAEGPNKLLTILTAPEPQT